MDVSGISSQVNGADYSPAQPAQVNDGTAQKKQDLSTAVETSVAKMMMDEQKLMGKGLLDMLA
jgi:hypothetical protein